MNMLTVKPESGRLAFPRFSNLLDNMFENEFSHISPNNFIKTPALVNVTETKEDYKISVAAPGFSKENISIKVEGNLLTLSGEQKSETEEKNQKFNRKEFNYTSFSRSFTLPKTVDGAKISAGYENGILNVVLPKREEAKEQAAFEIKVS